MPAARKPASLKQGKSESKEELAIREEIEKSLMGDSSQVYNVPEHLNERTKMFYMFIVQELEISGILSNLDIPILEQTADSLDKIRECDDALNKQGLVVESVDRYGHTQLKENPYVKVKMSYLTQFRALSNQLGLSPASRAALAGKSAEAKAEAEDPLIQALDV